MKTVMPFDLLKLHISRTGSFGGIRLYMTELIAITQTALQSQSWKMKAQGAAAMATVAREQTGSLVAPHLGMVLTALMQGLSGRTWAGKVLKPAGMCNKTNCYCASGFILPFFSRRSC